MSLSDKLLGKKTVNGKPHIEAITPACALPVARSASPARTFARPNSAAQRALRDVEGSVLISSDDFVVARVPEGAASGPIVIGTNGHVSNAHTIQVAAPIADNLHPVTNPAFDRDGNLFVTFSGSRGEKVPVAIFKSPRPYSLSVPKRHDERHRHRL